MGGDGSTARDREGAVSNYNNDSSGRSETHHRDGEEMVGGEGGDGEDGGMGDVASEGR